MTDYSSARATKSAAVPPSTARRRTGMPQYVPDRRSASTLCRSASIRLITHAGARRFDTMPSNPTHDLQRNSTARLERNRNHTSPERVGFMTRVQCVIGDFTC
jgi:hypothetical protein